MWGHLPQFEFHTTKLSQRWRAQKGTKQPHQVTIKIIEQFIYKKRCYYWILSEFTIKRKINYRLSSYIFLQPCYYNKVSIHHKNNPCFSLHYSYHLPSRGRTENFQPLWRRPPQTYCRPINDWQVTFQLPIFQLAVSWQLANCYLRNGQ